MKLCQALPLPLKEATSSFLSWLAEALLQGTGCQSKLPWIFVVHAGPAQPHAGAGWSQPSCFVRRFKANGAVIITWHARRVTRGQAEAARAFPALNSPKVTVAGPGLAQAKSVGMQLQQVWGSAGGRQGWGLAPCTCEFHLSWGSDAVFARFCIRAWCGSWHKCFMYWLKRTLAQRLPLLQLSQVIKIQHTHFELP